MAAYVRYFGSYLPPGFFDNTFTGDRDDEKYIPEPARIPPWSDDVFGSDKLTFILLGYDEVDEFAHRSDTLMIGAIDFIARKVRMISIPRDTLVYIPRYHFMKVNSAYALGGDDLVRRTIEVFSGVDIDYVITVNYGGFVEVVDALGGVDITVESAMHYDDRRGDVHIHIEAGEHHFDGEEALNYARFRMDSSGDFGRIERQQHFLAELFNQAIRPSNWTKLEGAARVFIDHIGVSANSESSREPPEIEFRHILSLIGFLKQLAEDDITFHQMPVIDLNWEGLACLVPIYSQTGRVLAEVFEDNDPIAWSTSSEDRP